MAPAQLLRRISRLASKPPGYLVRRVAREARMEADRLLAPLQAQRLTGERLARMAGVADIDVLWDGLAARPYPAVTRDVDAGEFSARFPEAGQAIRDAAQRAVEHRIDLLGTGPVDLGRRIDWLKDYKTGDRWEPAFCRSIDYVNRERPSDVKVPWEISRLQWVLPAGQAYLLTGDERYADAVREILDQWIDANPYAWTVNWSCTMEPALRIQSWTWLFHVFARSGAWRERAFRMRFLTALYLHGVFTELHIERSTVNGNHLTADAAGLVFAGLFFAGIGGADRWAREGWETLQREIQLQVHPDGVDFEASSAYHRLVTELFLLPARYRLALGQEVAAGYADRLAAMARFAAAYSRPDGTSPYWGDADDGRALPLGTQNLSDHRYLAGLVGRTFGANDLVRLSPNESDEVFWHCGSDGAASAEPVEPGSEAFPGGGVYILRNACNHVFIDCGPVGLAGLGGHGHNDALSFEAWLEGKPLIVDPGSFVYTASFEDRNAFRATAAHNTPQVDGDEINRFHGPDNLWNLHEDARAKVLAFEPVAGGGRFAGVHSGYMRLEKPVRIEREIVLSDRPSRLVVADRVEGEGSRAVSVPLHFAAGVDVVRNDDGDWTATAGGTIFQIAWRGAHWSVSLEETRVSPSYGIAVPAKRLVWRIQASLPLRLEVTLTAIPRREA